MEDRDALMRRIKKLLTLASDNPDSPESQSAAQKAGELMAKYKVDFASIEMEEDDIEVIDVKNYIDEDNGWTGCLVASVAQTFNCKAIREFNKNFRIFGYKHDVQLTTWMISYLRMIISKKADETCRTKKDRQNFGMGFVTSVNTRLKEVFSVQQQHVDVQTSALVVQKDGKVLEKFNKEYPKTVKRRAPKFSQDGNYYNGRDLGSKVALTRPVNGSNGSTSAIAA